MDAFECARELGKGAPPESLQAQLYRVVVAGIFFGLRRGELQHLLWSDTTGRQVYIQGKTLPGGDSWRPKDREARVIGYPGIERPIAVVFGEEPREGYVFAPVRDRRRPFVADWLRQSMERGVKPLSPELSGRLAEFARACKAATRIVSMYPATHPAIQSALGRIVEAGRHADLLQRGGLYAALWARQSGGFLAREAAE